MEWNHTLPQNNPLDEEDGDGDGFHARFAPHPHFSEPPPSQPASSFLSLCLFLSTRSFISLPPCKIHVTQTPVRQMYIYMVVLLLHGQSQMGETSFLFDLMRCSTRRNQSVVAFHIVFHSLDQALCSRNLDWSVIDSDNVQGDPTITLELKDGEYSHSMWDFSFQALYEVILQTKSLSTELVIKNADSKPFSFSTALHTYFRAAVQGASVNGLKGCKTLNKDPDPKNPLEGKEERDMITFPGFMDFVYLDAPNELHLDNGLGDVISIKNTDWTDAVLWNPYLTMEVCYKDFVCVENAKIGNVQLEPGNTWTATQHLSIN